MSHLFFVVDRAEGDAARSVQQLQAAQRGAEAIIATMGARALSLLEERKVVPSLILLNFHLADMNGIEFLGRVRQTRWLAQAPVAMLTDAMADRDVVNCYRLGVCAVLTKPVQAYELREAIRDFARPAQVVGGGGEAQVNGHQTRFSAA